MGLVPEGVTPPSPSEVGQGRKTKEIKNKLKSVEKPKKKKS